MRKRLFLFSLLCGCDGGATMEMPPAKEVFQANCTAGAPSAEAVRAAGRQMDGSVILPGGRRLTPAGKLIEVGGFPLAIRVLPGDRYAVVTDGALGDEALRIVDLQAKDAQKAIVSKQDYPRNQESAHSPALFYGLALTQDGKRLYVSNGGFDPLDDNVPAPKHYNTIEVFDIAGDPPQLVKNEALTIKLFFNPGLSMNGGAQSRLPAGLTLSSDEGTLYVATQNDSTLAIITVAQSPQYGTEIGRAALPGIGAYDVAVDEKSHTAFVSLWGGLTKGKGQYVDGVAVVDVTDPTKPVAMMEPLQTGKAAEAELLVAGKLYVANADADTLSIVDVASKSVKSMPVTASMLVGASPNTLAVDESAGRIYLANAGENGVVALDLQTLALKGRIPTAWYPTAVAVRGDGSLVIGSGKGLGLGPTAVSPSPGYMKGTLQVVPRPSDADLAAGDKIVADNLTRPRQIQTMPACDGGAAPRFALPLDAAGKTPIEHVFLIVRENKTYDSVFGDLETGNGKKDLVMFGESVTPNAHALARTFVTADNFYSNAEQSLQGHEWTTASIANDYAEKGWLTTWGRASRPTGAFASGTYQRLGRPGTDTIWTHLDAAGLAYHNYGEVVNTEGAHITLDPAYPGVIFDLGTPDVQKIQKIIDDLTDPMHVVEPFVYIGLPNDHTYGTTPKRQTPQSMVADNDEATGRFIDALSHSALWPSSVVFIIEDDPSDGGDHVEPHRSLFMAASPWIKRGYHSSANYDVPSLYRTIETLLHVGPMNVYDGNAAAMYDLFSAKADPTPYTFLPRTVPEGTNPSNAPLAEESRKIDFSKPDQSALGRILWKATHGEQAEPPWRTAGEVSFTPDGDDD